MAIDTTKKVKKITVDGASMPFSSVIDTNIQPENIKKDVTILGITGTLEEGITPTGTKTITSNGTYDVTEYAIASVSVPSTTSDNTIPRTPTLLYIKVNGSLVLPLNFSRVSGTIDWGDGSGVQELQSSMSHGYTATGNYIIKIRPSQTTGTLSYNSDNAQIIFGTGSLFVKKNVFGENSAGQYSNVLYKVSLGASVFCKPYAFAHCINLSIDVNSFGVPYTYLGSGVSIENEINTAVFYNSHTGTYTPDMEFNTLELSPNITRIGDRAFDGSSYSTLIIKPSITDGSNGIIPLSFSTALPTGLTKIYVPTENLSAYQTATNWSNFASIMVAY